MFSLIISIIAIALVAALALASIYYGGTAFQQGSADAEAATVINQGQQIQGAVTMSIVAEDARADVAALAVVGAKGQTFLKEAPTVRGNTWSATDTDTSGTLNYGDVILMVVANADVCDGIEARAVANYVDGSFGSAVDDTRAFGCYVTGTVHTAFYNL